MNTEQRILCLAARTSLEPIAERQLSELLRGSVDWERLWAQGHLHEVLPLVTSTLRRLAGRAPIPGAWLARAQRRYYATMMRNTALADQLLRVLTAFRQAGLAALPVKGVVLAETLYGSLALRPLGDLDVLVNPHDLPAARAALGALGFFQADEPGYENAYHPYHDPPYYLKTEGGTICLELHWGLWANHFFQLATDALWRRAVSARIHGADVSILSPEDTLLHLAIHRSRSALRLRFVCDVAELLRCHRATLDWEYLLAQTHAAGARTTMFYTLALAKELLDAPLPDGVLARLHVSRLKRRLLEHTCGATALFRPHAPDNLTQQPSLILRVFEQDGAAHIVQALAASLNRTARKNMYFLMRGLTRWRGLGR
ncbi:MAG TPA: nucleotidyltransferase family protein [Roseiflexaceae bacterium]|nr:nucleotidyltransferase family protein [Roseiflexaceae bacterium]